MFLKFATKVLHQTAKCGQLIKKIAKNMNFYAEILAQFKKKAVILR